ncbi:MULTISPECIES: hypothetical protein [unclassified Bradyrhizobium]|uniref:hypothetical protein n=1 Tax=unclassified Bradyrhizobium TaxID=2631580 RepID=UPI00247AFACD|nr:MULTISPECIES: hypothetical protein [unclassified Bradyrhizobium]WGR74838.1 hypothetical protein MTX24_19280 [Bradyrhizobium sp. ISRA426]WGR79674.1 hypothetical protein MTX21_04395 [Bradyrhizobium sp. ISRA430]WGR90010.1 hypothetical protein MTX25_18960 [Bradyrhizobium sp. ISRA432]
MSTLFANSYIPARLRRNATMADHQRNSWLVPLDRWLASSERMHQRADLRAIADDPHLLADLGLTREEALEQADLPFWR